MARLSAPAVANHATEVRAPTAGDEENWRRLWTDYLAFYRTDVPASVTDRTWSRLMDDTVPMIARVVLLDGRLVGFGLGVIHEATWHLQPTFYLEDLFVAAEARSRGAARAIIDHFVGVGRERGWSSIYWHTQAGNTRARRMYEQYVSADDFVRYKLRLE